MAMFKKVAFTMFPAADPQRAREFYGGVLGLKLGLHSSDGVWTEYDLPGGGCLALFGTKEVKPSHTAGGSIALEVDDLDALCAQLKEKRVEFTQEIIHGPNCRMATILDSEGNAIILHELKKRPETSA
jgi:predicted enzyme related to lactoylglutathione lyase